MNEILYHYLQNTVLYNLTHMRTIYNNLKNIYVASALFWLLSAAEPEKSVI